MAIASLYEEERLERLAERNKAIAEVWAKKGDKYKKKLAEIDLESKRFQDKMQLFDKAVTYMVTKNLSKNPAHYAKAKPNLLSEELANPNKSPLKKAQKSLDKSYLRRMRFGGNLVPSSPSTKKDRANSPPSPSASPDDYVVDKRVESPLGSQTKEQRDKTENALATTLTFWARDMSE